MTSGWGGLVEASARAEQVVAAILVLILVALLASCVARSDRAGHAARWEAWLSGPRELVMVGAIGVLAFAFRAIGRKETLTAPFWFSEVPTLYVADALRRGTAWQQWIAQLSNFQTQWTHQSAIAWPPLVAAQLLLGPSFGLPLLVGACWGTAAVVLAWAFGRAAESRLFGFAFAALVAFSPLQLAWSRLGGIYITSTTYLLLVFLLAWIAAARGSYALALVAGSVTWGSIYSYYLARLAFPLVFVLVITAAMTNRDQRRRAWRLVACVGLGLVLAYAACRPSGSLQSVWPNYTGYAGHRGERGLADEIRQAVAPARKQLGLTLRAYFRADRMQWEAPPALVRWGMQYGGLSLVPVAMFGLLGLGRTLSTPRRWWWLLFAAGGLAAPTLSLSSARRLLAFDLAWCGLAAHGLCALAAGRVSRGVPFGALRAGVLGLVAGLGAWSFTTVVALNAVLPRGYGQRIPFGESGFGDGLTCPRCMEAGKDLRSDITAGRMIVLFENDVHRENRTSPGGLPVYARIAAEAVERPGNVLEFYAAVRNWDVEPPAGGSMYDGTALDFGSYLVDRIAAAKPTGVVWHFERPLPWERWLIDRLVAAGGRATTFATPLSTAPGVEVRTGPADWERVQLLLRDLGRQAHDRSGCIELLRGATRRYPFPVVFVGAVGSFEVGPLARRSSALDCAAWVDDAWWTVDPVRGTVSTTSPVGVDWLPPERWVGIATPGPAELLLASADQLIVQVDVRQRRELGRTSAIVGPMRLRTIAGECAPVLVGTGWRATFDGLTTVLSVYDAQGRFLGAPRLDRVLGINGIQLAAVAARDDQLAVAYDNVVQTVALQVKPDCRP